jgi:hypothetical protein
MIRWFMDARLNYRLDRAFGWPWYWALLRSLFPWTRKYVYPPHVRAANRDHYTHTVRNFEASTGLPVEAHRTLEASTGLPVEAHRTLEDDGDAD